MRYPMTAAIVAGICLCVPWVAGAQDWHGILGDIAGRAANKAADKAMDKATQSSQPAPASASQAKPANASQPGSSAAAASDAQGSGQPPFKAYQNYDFVPGDKIVFDDDFHTDADGEFPAHWKLLKGQGVINIMQGAPVFALTEASSNPSRWARP